MAAFPYRITTEWSDEDNVYVARIPALPGVAAHGDSPEEATKEARVAANGMLKVMKARKRAIPAGDSTADYSGQLRIRLTRALHLKLARMAEEESMSLNSLMLEILAERVGELRSKVASVSKSAHRKAKAG